MSNKIEKNLSWPLGILIAPVLIIVTVITCLAACVAIVACAVIGKVKITVKEKE